MTDASRAHAIEPEIERFIAEGQYSLAVILSQTMLELLVEQEAKALAERLDTGAFGSAALELLGGFNLNRRTQRFFEHALDLCFDQEMPDEMHAFLVHNRLRNRIVHEGAEATREEAEASHAAVRGVTSRLHTIIVERTGGAAGRS